MKTKDISNYELGEHCYGSILRINGEEYEDISEEDAIEFINDMFKNDINRGSIIRGALKICLEHLQFDLVDNHSNSCEQCGNWNYYEKYER